MKTKDHSRSPVPEVRGLLGQISRLALKGFTLFSVKLNMKDNRCFICKFRQKTTRIVNHDTIYDGRGNGRQIGLCYPHSVELFKVGQSNFILRHRNVFANSFGFEADSDLVSAFRQGRKESSWY